MITILDAASLGHDLNLSGFHSVGRCTIWSQTSEDELVDRIRDTQIIVTNRAVLSEQVLKETKRLELIALTATGFNNIDIEYCKKKGIHVANVGSYSTESVAQHCFSMLFYLLEKTRFYDDYVRKRQYDRYKLFADVSKPWFEIFGKTWGIIGMGSIGRRVADIASAFGAQPIYFSTSGVKRYEKYDECSLPELLERSDIVSVHAPLNKRTENLMGISEFKKMKNHSIFLNLGRGGILDESALYQALKENWISCAGLDVMATEPPEENNPLLTLIGERLLITPHNAWGSTESRNKLINEVIKNIEAHLKGESRNLIV